MEQLREIPWLWPCTPLVPLITRMSSVNLTRQVCYADDSTTGGSIEDLCQWWSVLTNIGPQYGYYPNPSKTWLLIKENSFDRATSEGRPVLCSLVGTNDFITRWVTNNVVAWVSELETLTNISHSQP